MEVEVLTEHMEKVQGSISDYQVSTLSVFDESRSGSSAKSQN